MQTTFIGLINVGRTLNDDKEYQITCCKFQILIIKTEMVFTLIFRNVLGFQTIIKMNE